MFKIVPENKSWRNYSFRCQEIWVVSSLLLLHSVHWIAFAYLLGIFAIFGIDFYKCASHSSVGKESTCDAGDPGSIPGSGRFPGEGIGYPLWYSWASCVAQLVKNLPGMWEPWLEKTPGERKGFPLQYSGPGEWGSQSRTRLSDFHFQHLFI